LFSLVFFVFCDTVKLCEVGVPKSIAKRMTVPEIVTHFNRTRMQNIVLKGTEELGGALYVEKKSDGARFDLSFCKLQTIAAELRVGDTVERMLQNGDPVVLNRQPQVFF